MTSKSDFVQLPHMYPLTFRQNYVQSLRAMEIVQEVIFKRSKQ